MQISIDALLEGFYIEDIPDTTRTSQTQSKHHKMEKTKTQKTQETFEVQRLISQSARQAKERTEVENQMMNAWVESVLNDMDE